MNKHEPVMDDHDNKEKKTGETEDLPELPLPDLKASADHLTRWFTPVLSNEQRARTRAALNAFLKPGGLGEKLQQKLLDHSRAENSKNWLAPYWNSRFAERRDPVVLNDNYFFLFRQGPRQRSHHAASLIAAVLNYKLVLDQGQIPLAVERPQPLCEDRFIHLFSTTRIPEEKADSLAGPHTTDQPQTPTPQHIVVFCRGNIHRLDLIGAEGVPHSLADIEKGLNFITDHSIDEQATGRAIGHLTTLPRSDWARTRRSLIQGSEKNADPLALIENALFSVHLEDHHPEDNLAACNELLHGNSANRWFDKSLQFIVFRDGYAGLNVEQSALDRADIIDFLDYVLGIDADSVDQYSGAANQGCPVTRELTFDLTPVFQKKILRAAAGFDRLKAPLAARTIEFTDYHDKLLSQKGVSPDAFVLCALQLAHYRQNGKFIAISQNISMRHFASGRIQSLWALTSQMVDFVTCMTDEKTDDLDRFKALQDAARSHEEQVMECREGKVPEQHFSELLNIYKRQPEDFQTDFLTRVTSGGLSQADIDSALALFDSSGWKSMHTGAVNSSFLASPHIVHQGFASVAQRNISLGCMIHATTLNIFLSSPDHPAEQFAELASTLEQALCELHDLLGLNLDHAVGQSAE